MTIIDERGRLFGRINIVDAGLVLIAVVLVPLAYGAYMLFRPQPVRLLSVEPGRVLQGRAQRVQIRGESLQPFLRAQVGDAQPRALFVDSPTTAEAEVPPLPPGTYDVALHNESREVARLSRALTIVGAETAAPVYVRLVGALLGLDEARARELKPGRRLPDAADPIAEVIEAGAPAPEVRRLRIGDTLLDVPVKGSLRVPAVLRIACTLIDLAHHCRIGEVNVEPGQLMRLPGWGDFAIDDVRPDAPPISADIGVRFVGSAETLDLMAVGDRDVHPAGVERGATIVALGERRAVPAELVVELPPPPGALALQQRIGGRDLTVEGVMRLSADQMPTGLRYRAHTIKVGGWFTFETSRYIARGMVTRVSPPPAAAPANTP